MGITKNYAWWPDIGEIRLPAIQSSFIILLKMLSIKVWLRLVNLVGEVMLGTRLVEYMMSRKSETFLFESHFRRSILKSPSNITSLFSLINFSERGFRYLSLNSLLYTWMSIYASYYHIFGVLLDYFNKNRLQFPFL